MFGFGKNPGKVVANRIADHLRLDHNLFDTALTEMNISWQSWNALADTRMTTEALASQVVPSLIAGLKKLEERFGQQDEIAAALRKLEPMDMQTQIDAADAAKAYMALDPDRRFETATEVLRNEALKDWITTIELPGEMDAARTVSMLWASVADRSITAEFVAETVNLPLARAKTVCEELASGGAMAFGTGRDGIKYYKLSQTGLNAGRHISEQWLSITRMWP